MKVDVHSTSLAKNQIKGVGKNQELPIVMNNNKNSSQQNEEVVSPITRKTLEITVKGLNQSVKSTNTHLQFKLHEGLGEYYIKVINDITGDVVKEIPSKEFLDRVQKMFEFAGLIVDEKR